MGKDGSNYFPFFSYPYVCMYLNVIIMYIVTTVCYKIFISNILWSMETICLSVVSRN